MTKEKIDVYRAWLKIEATNRPLNYYQLLKLKAFEDDLQVIRKHYRELNAHVRKYATGNYIEESQSLLNELAKAMLCLTDVERKEEYDFSLGRQTKETTRSGRRSFEDILVEDRLLSPEQIKKAERYAEAVGIGLEMAILQQKQADPEKIMVAFAESQGFPFINLDDCPVDEYYAPQIDPNMARTHSFIPVMADMGKLILASPTPLDLDVEESLRVLFEMPIRSAICLPTQVNAAIDKYYPRGAVQVRVAKGEKTAEASGSGKQEGQSTAEGKADAKKTKKNSASVKEKTSLSAAAKANRLKISAITFNFSAMTTFFAQTMLIQKPTMLSMILWGAIVGGIAGTIAWVLTSKEIEADKEDTLKNTQ